LTLER